MSRDSLLLLLLAALLFLPGLGARDLWAPDEPRQAEVAREMLLSGDWIVPRDSGRLYPDKPPLLPWMIALASLPGGGVGPWSARLPSALCGIGMVLLTAALGRLWYGRWAGFAAGVILATSARGFISSRWAQTDAPLALFSTLAILGLARARERAGRPAASDLGCLYGGIAGALLAKGPVGMIVPALVAAGWAWLAPGAGRRERDSGGTEWLLHLRPWLLVVAVVPALGWALAAGAASGGAYSLSQVFHEQMIVRATQGLHHPHSPLYYLGSLPLEFLPWTIFVAAWSFLPHRGAAQPAGPAAAPADRAAAGKAQAGAAPAGTGGRRQPGIWLALCVAFFTLSADKRSVYLLPAMPAAALLLAGLWPREPWPRRGETGRVWILAPFVALAALAPLSFLTPAVSQRALGSGAVPLSFVAASVCAAAALALVLAIRGRGRAAFASAAVVPAALLLGAALALAPALNPLKSARPFCERVLGHLGARDPLAIHAPYRSAYAFYTGRFLDELHGGAELARFMEQPGARCILERRQLEALPAAAQRRYTILEEAPVGHRRMLLIGASGAEPGPGGGAAQRPASR